MTKVWDIKMKKKTKKLAVLLIFLLLVNKIFNEWKTSVFNFNGNYSKHHKNPKKVLFYVVQNYGIKFTHSDIMFDIKAQFSAAVLFAYKFQLIFCSMSIIFVWCRWSDIWSI